MKKAQTKQLTSSGVNILSTTTSNPITSDGVYQSGNLGFMSLVVNITGNVSISYQLSFDNINWFTPSTTDGTNLTSAGGIVTSLTTNAWIVLTAMLAPYVRFIFTPSGSSTITANTLWQDES